MNENTVFARVRKNSSDDIVVDFSDFGGHQLIDARVFRDFAGDGEKKPSKKGISIKIEHLQEPIGPLQQAEAEARCLGLVR